MLIYEFVDIFILGVDNFVIVVYGLSRWMSLEFDNSWSYCLLSYLHDFYLISKGLLGWLVRIFKLIELFGFLEIMIG